MIDHAERLLAAAAISSAGGSQRQKPAVAKSNLNLCTGGLLELVAQLVEQRTFNPNCGTHPHADSPENADSFPANPERLPHNRPLTTGFDYCCILRRSPLKRYTPLPRPTAPIKRSPLPRSRKPIAKMSKRGQRRAAKWRESGMVAFAASGGMCVRCLIRPAVHRHHKRKRRAGDDTPGNCCPLCELCHCFVEEHPKEAAAEGFVVSVNQSPLAKGAAA